MAVLLVGYEPLISAADGVEAAGRAVAG